MPHSLANVSSKLQDLLLSAPCKRQAEESHKVLSPETIWHRNSKNNDQDLPGRAWFFSQENIHTHTSQLLKSNILQFNVLQDLKTHKAAGMVNSTLLKLCVLGQTLRRALAKQLYLKLHSPPPPLPLHGPVIFSPQHFPRRVPSFLTSHWFPSPKVHSGRARVTFYPVPSGPGTAPVVCSRRPKPY